MVLLCFYSPNAGSAHSLYCSGVQYGASPRKTRSTSKWGRRTKKAKYDRWEIPYHTGNKNLTINTRPKKETQSESQIKQTRQSSRNKQGWCKIEMKGGQREHDVLALKVDNMLRVKHLQSVLLIKPCLCHSRCPYLPVTSPSNLISSFNWIH